MTTYTSAIRPSQLLAAGGTGGGAREAHWPIPS